MWRGTRGSGDDHAGGYFHGDTRRCAASDEGSRSAHRALTGFLRRKALSMEKQAVRDRILQIGIVPVVRASSPGEARTAAECVCKGGIPIVEITMTVPGAIDVIRELAKHAASELLVGAGTVLNAETARRCLDAGAQFLVSTGFNA